MSVDGTGGTAATGTSPDRELAVLRFQSELTTQLDGVREAHKALKIALRKIRDFFDADEACIAVIEPDRAGATPRWLLPASEWEPDLFVGFLREHRPKLPRPILLASFPRRERPWGIIGLRRNGRDFERSARRELQRVARALGKLVERADRLAIAEVRARIDGKIMAELRPKDLFYQILHGLRSLTRYDHSGALLIHDPQRQALDLVAEQIAWRKGKSRHVGRAIPVDAAVQALLGSNEVYVFDRIDGEWTEARGRDACALARALDYNTHRDDEPAEQSMLCAPFATRTGAAGVIKLTARHVGSLGRYEARLLRRFVPQAVIAMHNQERAASLEVGMLEAEKKHVMANLARGVSHDINNALGSMLPLVQQMRADADEERVNPAVLRDDLEQLEESVQVCRRIFNGMLNFARGAAQHLGTGDVRRAVKSTLSILAEGMRRQGVEVELDLAARLPAVRGDQGDLEQLVLNLATNARDSMPKGGTLRIEAVAHGAEVVVTIRDTGVGISDEDLARVQEPFFTTKLQGNGLGLSICRSIVWGLEGRMNIESGLGEGTTIQLNLPAVRADGSSDA